MMTSEVMDHFLTQQLENAGSMIDLLYECYASKATTDNELIRESFFVLERCTKDMVMAISMYPTSLDDLMDVADNGDVMPPKSTWFEPKLRSGLLIHKI